MIEPPDDHATHHFDVDDPAGLLRLIEQVARWALDEGRVFAVFSAPSHGFVQLLCDDDGTLHLESSAGSHAIAANLGYADLVPDFDFLAHGVLPPEWAGRDRITAEVFTRTLLDVHHLELPTRVKVFVSHTVSNEKNGERPDDLRPL